MVDGKVVKPVANIYCKSYNPLMALGLRFESAESLGNSLEYKPLQQTVYIHIYIYNRTNFSRESFHVDEAKLKSLFFFFFEYIYCIFNDNFY